MAEHQVAERPTDTPAADSRTTDASSPVMTFLRDEFPEWEIEVGTTESFSGDVKELWVARRDGHHPQSELSPAKLHTRLSNYLERERARLPRNLRDASSN